MIIIANEITMDSLSSNAGKLIAERIISEYNTSEKITIDFKDTDSHTSLFFNALFGILANEYGVSILDKIVFINESNLDKETHMMCIDNTKSHLSNPKYSEAVKGNTYEDK